MTNPEPFEYRRQLDRHEHNRPILRKIVADWKTTSDSWAVILKNKLITFTNGCFDGGLHAGHTALLRFCATLPEMVKTDHALVVGINTDESVRRLKGPSRPLYPFWFRAFSVACFTEVTLVIGFNEMSPNDLISVLRPHRLIKGAEYLRNGMFDDIDGAKYVLNYGGSVAAAPMVSDLSTTKFIEHVRSLPAEEDDPL